MIRFLLIIVCVKFLDVVECLLNNDCFLGLLIIEIDVFFRGMVYSIFGFIDFIVRILVKKTEELIFLDIFLKYFY